MKRLPKNERHIVGARQGAPPKRAIPRPVGKHRGMTPRQRIGVVGPLGQPDSQNGGFVGGLASGARR